MYVYSDNGTLLSSWTAGTLASKSVVEGIATDGTDVWIVDSATNRIDQFDNAAGVTSSSLSPSVSFPLAPGNTNPQGIADLLDADWDATRRRIAGDLLVPWHG